RVFARRATGWYVARVRSPRGRLTRSAIGGGAKGFEHVPAVLGGAAAGLGCAAVARDPDPLGSPQYRLWLAVHRAAGLCLSCAGYVVADALAVSRRSAGDGLSVAWLFAAAGLSSCDLSS